MIKAIELVGDKKRFWQNTSASWIVGHGLTIFEDGDHIVLRKEGKTNEYRIPRSICIIEKTIEAAPVADTTKKKKAEAA